MGRKEKGWDGWCGEGRIPGAEIGNGVVGSAENVGSREELWKKSRGGACGGVEWRLIALQVRRFCLARMIVIYMDVALASGEGGTAAGVLGGIKRGSGIVFS